MNKTNANRREEHRVRDGLFGLAYLGLFGFFSGTQLAWAEDHSKEWDALDPSLRGPLGYCLCQCYCELEDEPLCLQLEESPVGHGPTCVYWYDTFDYDSRTCLEKNGAVCTGFGFRRQEYRTRGSQECEWIPMDDRNA